MTDSLSTYLQRGFITRQDLDGFIADMIDRYELPALFVDDPRITGEMVAAWASLEKQLRLAVDLDMAGRKTDDLQNEIDDEVIQLTQVFQP